MGWFRNARGRRGRPCLLVTRFYVDSGFCFVRFNPRDQQRGDACEKQDWLEALLVVVAWPILYEAVVQRTEAIDHWDGCDGHGRPLSAGIYFYRLQAGSVAAVEKMVLLK